MGVHILSDTLIVWVLHQLILDGSLSLYSPHPFLLFLWLSLPCVVAGMASDRFLPRRPVYRLDCVETQCYVSFTGICPPGLWLSLCSSSCSVCHHSAVSVRFPSHPSHAVLFHLFCSYLFGGLCYSEYGSYIYIYVYIYIYILYIYIYIYIYTFLILSFFVAPHIHLKSQHPHPMRLCSPHPASTIEAVLIQSHTV